jgi:hypothetical protein
VGPVTTARERRRRVAVELRGSARQGRRAGGSSTVARGPRLESMDRPGEKGKGPAQGERRTGRA